MLTVDGRLRRDQRTDLAQIELEGGPVVVALVEQTAFLEGLERLELFRRGPELDVVAELALSRHDVFRVLIPTTGGLRCDADLTSPDNHRPYRRLCSRRALCVCFTE